MTEPAGADPRSIAAQILEEGERIERSARAVDGAVVVTDRRVAVATGERVALDVPFEGLRRIQFDIERRRPATLVLVPEHASREAQVLTIPTDQLEEVAHTLAVIGTRMAAAG